MAYLKYILIGLIFVPFFVLAINISVPSANNIGDVLIGNAQKTYTPTATSSLFSGLVPYTGATSGVNLGNNSLWASGFMNTYAGDIAFYADNAETLTGDIIVPSAGIYYFQNVASGEEINAMLDVSNVLSSSKSFIFPNKSGTFALLDDFTSSLDGIFGNTTTTNATVSYLTVPDYIDFDNVGKNTKIGFEAGKNIEPADGFGGGSRYNTFIGYQAGYSAVNSTSDGYNIAIGYRALPVNTTGIGNYAIGYGALSKNTEGNSNMAFGLNALDNNTTGNYNTAVGIDTLINNATGSSNVALGLFAGQNEMGSNAFYVNNIVESTTANDKNYSLLYGKFSGVSGSLTGQQLTVNGLLGVGTTSPSNTLEVNGSGYFTGNLRGANITATGTLNITGNTTLANASTTELTVANRLTAGSLSVGSLSGVLKATAGLVTGSATTDDLTQGSTNLYWSNALFDTRLNATTSLPNLATWWASLLSGTTTTALPEGTNLYWTNNRFDTRLYASTSLPLLASLNGLSTIGSSTGQTTILGKTVMTNASTTNLTIGTAGYLTGLGSSFLAVNQNGQIIATTTPLISSSGISNWKYTTALTPTTTVAVLLPSTLTVSGNSSLQNASTTNLSASGWLTVDGNVGIGTASPSNKLTVSSNVNNSATLIYDDTSGLEIRNNSSAANSYGLLTFYSGVGGDKNYIQSIAKANNDYDLAFGFRKSDATGGEQMRITSSGNVGIGSSTPTSLLSLGNGVASTTITMGKIQFDGKDASGTRYCVYIQTGAWVFEAKPCTQ
jgi:hypothetical protein